jgi:hypothetical protein
MSQIHLKFEFDRLGKFRNWWNLTRELLNSPNGQINLSPMNLRFMKKSLWLTSRFNLNLFKFSFCLLKSWFVTWSNSWLRLLIRVIMDVATRGVTKVKLRSLLNIIKDWILRTRTNSALSRSWIIWWGVNIFLSLHHCSLSNMHC